MSRQRSAALQQLLDDLTAERHRPLPGAVDTHDPAEARRVLLAALRGSDDDTEEEQPWSSS